MPTLSVAPDQDSETVVAVLLGAVTLVGAVGAMVSGVDAVATAELIEVLGTASCADT